MTAQHHLENKAKSLGKKKKGIEKQRHADQEELSGALI